MQRIVWEDFVGRIVCFEDKAPFFLSHFDGNFLSADALSEKIPLENGRLTYSSTYSVREIKLFGTLYTTNDMKKMYELQSFLCALFDPTRVGKMIYENDFGSYFIYARPKKLPKFDIRIQTSKTFEIEFVCDDPFWKNINENVYPIGSVQSGMTFPWQIPNNFGFWSEKTLINNHSFIDTPVVIEIFDTAEKICVMNLTSGLKTDILHRIENGEKMVIDTGEKIVHIYEMIDGIYKFKQDASFWLTAESEYWQLVPGKNEILFNNGYQQFLPMGNLRFYTQFLEI